MQLFDRLCIQLRARRDLVIVLVFAVIFTGFKIHKKFDLEAENELRLHRQRRFGQIYQAERER